jgi:ATP-dependent helicase HrpB
VGLSGHLLVESIQVPKYGLPIDDALPELSAALAENASVVLQAPPGAGKSTVVPLALLQERWVANKRLIMLEPRRLAARAVAQRMAQTLGEPVGRTIGYRMRMDTRVSTETRIEVVTEGVLARMLQSDPALEGVAAVIFDEFHERSLQADLGLALTLDARANLAPELKIIVMSATLDGEAVARLLGHAPIVTAQGRAYPVESRYLGKGAPLLPGALPAGTAYDAAERAVAQHVCRALKEESGDVLVFLPGAREIHRVRALLEADSLEGNVNVLPLFGELSAADQDMALSPAQNGVRKVVLATNIAETSLTIPGIRVVVDSGLARRSVFDPSTGMSRLETQRISRASADQRQGRAGRLEAGVCYRAWSAGAHRSLAPFSAPEIADADLVPLALELAAWGVRDATDLQWLDAPPTSTLSSARDLLQRLGALDAEGRITAHGREMARLSTHPRLAHMLLKAPVLGATRLAAELAALLSERDLLRGSNASRDADVRTRLEYLRSDSDRRMDRGAVQRARRSARDFERQLATGESVLAPRAEDARGRSDAAQEAKYDDAPWDSANAGPLLAFAYPDRIGRRRSGAEARYTLTNGRGAYFADVQGLGKQEFIVAVDLDDKERDARILLAAPLDRADIEEHFADRLQREESVEWSDREQAVIARRVLRLDGIVIEEKPAQNVSPDATRAAMLDGIRKLGIAALPWSQEARDLQARIEFMRKLDPDWPDVSDAALAQNLDSWLAPFLDGVTRRDHLARVQLTDAVRSLLPWDQQRKLDELAPTHLTVPTGSRIRIDYLDESAPVVSVRLQEVFGLESSPRLGGGRVPVTFKLLSPAQRPVQVTRDLASFWRGSYADVRKDMRGRYPKHYWPENPLEAEPTRGVRRKN